MDNAKNSAFMILLGVSQALGISMVILVIVWTSQTFNGYAWDGSAKEFNLHPLCMVCGFILLYGEAALAFRVFSHHHKSLVKVIHGAFHILAFLAAVVGLSAVFDFHNASNIKNMYSLHSWCGMVTILLFCIQYVFGFVALFYPRLSSSIRQSYMPIHRYFGLGIFFLAALSAVSGINEKLFFKFAGGSGASVYQDLPHGAVVGNCLGLAIAAYVIVIGFIVHNPDWQRQEDPETVVQFKAISSHGESTDEED